MRYPETNLAPRYWRDLIPYDPLPPKRLRAAKPPSQPKRKRSLTPAEVETLRNVVTNMAGYNFSIDKITLMTGVRAKALYRHYGDVLRTATIRKNLAVIQSAFLQAVGGPEQKWDLARPNMTARWLENAGIWVPPTQKIALATYDLSKLDDAQLDLLEELALQAQPSAQLLEHDPDEDERRS